MYPDSAVSSAQRTRGYSQPIASLALTIVAICGIGGLYLVKSALGINIFPGHAPILHAMLYPLIHG